MAISSFLKPLRSDPFWFTYDYFFPVHYIFQLYYISQLGRIWCVCSLCSKYWVLFGFSTTIVLKGDVKGLMWIMARNIDSFFKGSWDGWVFSHPQCSLSIIIVSGDLKTLGHLGCVIKCCCCSQMRLKQKAIWFGANMWGCYAKQTEHEYIALSWMVVVMMGW